jgi:hypothetical protein
MVRHKPWQFFIIRFIAGNKKHTVSVGVADREETLELIKDMYGKIRALRIIPRVNQE